MTEKERSSSKPFSVTATEGVPLRSTNQQQEPETRIRPTSDRVKVSQRAKDVVENYELAALNLYHLGAGELADAEELLLRYIADVEEARDAFRNQLRHLAALCGMASAKLCAPVSEKDIAFAKGCVESGIYVMRQLVEEERDAPR